jgi:hypothetical protein
MAIRLCLNNGGPVFNVGRLYCTRTAGHKGIHRTRTQTDVTWEWTADELAAAVARAELKFRGISDDGYDNDNINGRLQ